MTWWISVSGSLCIRCWAHAASIGRPLSSTSTGNMMPSLRFALCEIASSLVARLALGVHPGPEILGMMRIDGRERHGRHLLRVPEEDVAVHVPAVRRRGPLVGDERRELAGLVVLVGDRDDSASRRCPATSGSTSSLMGSFLARLPGEPLEDLVELLRAYSTFSFCGDRQLAEGRVRVVRERDRARVFRVVGHAMEVQRATLDLHLEAGRVLDRLAHVNTCRPLPGP